MCGVNISRVIQTYGRSVGWSCLHGIRKMRKERLRREKEKVT